MRVVQSPASLRFVGRATFEGVTGAGAGRRVRARPGAGAFPGDPAPDPTRSRTSSSWPTLSASPRRPRTRSPKLAGGLADNLLTSAALANVAPLVVAPAMNNRMWSTPPRERTSTRCAPAGAGGGAGQRRAGRHAASGGWAGWRSRRDPGGDPVLATGGPMDRLRVLVTAGGTREPIDSVRYVGNRSSGGWASRSPRRRPAAALGHARVRARVLPAARGRPHDRRGHERGARGSCRSGSQAPMCSRWPPRRRTSARQAAADKISKTRPRWARGRARAHHRHPGRRLRGSSPRPDRWWASRPSTARVASSVAREAPARASTPSSSTTYRAPTSASTSPRTRSRS